MEKNKWIRVEDDLPDYDVPVLWYSEDGLMHVEDLDKDGNPWLYERMVEGFPLARITHWMPLPESPIELPNDERTASQQTMPKEPNA